VRKTTPPKPPQKPATRGGMPCGPAATDEGSMQGNVEHNLPDRESVRYTIVPPVAVTRRQLKTLEGKAHMLTLTPLPELAL
jgi:hypothetical protein